MSKKSDGHGVLLGRTHINISHMHSMDSEIRWSLSAQIQETLRRKGKSEPRGAETGSMPKIKSLELIWWESQEQSKKRIFEDF